MIQKRREARHALRTGTNREDMIDDHIDRKSAKYMPAEIESNVFRTSIMLPYSPDPETDEKKGKYNWLAIREGDDKHIKPRCIDDKMRTYKLKDLYIEVLEESEESHRIQVSKFSMFTKFLKLRSVKLG